MEDKGQALGWEDEGQVQESGYDVLPEGEYTYEVVNFKREHFGGSPKMNACPVAALQLKCTSVEKGFTATGFCRLYLNSKVMWRISNFFKSCGLLDPNASEGASMPMSLFGQVVGCTGRVKIKVSKSKSNGKEYENNDFNFVVPKGNSPAPASAAPAQQQSWGGKSF